MKKKNILFLCLFFLACISFFYLLFLREHKPTHVNFNSQNDLEIAENLLKFVDTSLDETNENYQLIYDCSKEQHTCSAIDDTTLPPHMGYAIMSMKEIGEVSSNQSWTQKSQKLIDSAIEKCSLDQRYCEWNFFPLHLYFKTTNEKKYLEAMLSVSEDVMIERPIRELLDRNIPVKWWRLYDATRDPQYLTRLTELANQQLRTYPLERENDDIIYTNQNISVRSYDISIAWGLYIPAYQATKDKTYLKPIIDLFESAELANHVESFNSIKDTGDLTKGIEALITLASALPDQSNTYINESENIIRSLLSERWDTPDQKIINGDFGLLVSPTQKATNIQGWVAHTLLQLHKTKSGL